MHAKWHYYLPVHFSVVALHHHLAHVVKVHRGHVRGSAGGAQLLKDCSNLGLSIATEESSVHKKIN